MLDSFFVILAIDNIRKDFRRTSVFSLVVFRKEQLRQADLLFSSAHLGHGTFRGPRKQIRLESREILILSTTTPLDTVFQVDQETEICDSTVVIAVSTEDLEASSGQRRSV